MSTISSSPQDRSFSRRFIPLFLAPLLLICASPVVGQTHVGNPFAGATMYVNPDYAKEIDTSIAQTTDPNLAAQMATVKTYPTAVWLDSMAAISGNSAGGGRLGLTEHLNAALSQQKGTTPVTAIFVVYDLPGRDCAALASNGEIPATSAGLTEYESQYIDPIVSILSGFSANSNLRVVTVIEPDSLPNAVTNTGMPACATAAPFYESGIEYAISKLHALPNVYIYLDIGHSAWLGWPNNMSGAVTEYTKVVRAAGGLNLIDGFITDTANYTPTVEPFYTGTTTVGGQQVTNANFYQSNPNINESDYAAALYTNMVGAGFPSSIGFLLDTSRNGWGGPARPTSASTSTDLNTFVNASKIDLRNHRGLWCNVSGSGMGAPPQASPSGFPNSHYESFVWVKPPGESDGTYLTSVTPHADNNCNPADNNNQTGTPTMALPNAPAAGNWFPAEFQMLVQNSFPVVPGGSVGTPDFSLAASPATLTVNRGTSGTSTISVTRLNSFAGAVSFTATGLPSGVTASFNPTATTTSGTSTVLTLSASSTATTGNANITVTGTSGTLSHTTTLTLTVGTGSADFSLAASPTSLTVNPGSSGTSTISVTRLNSFAGAVSFTATGLPSGVTASFNPTATTTTGTSSVLTLSASSTATAGAATVTVTGTSGTLSHTTTIALTVGSGGGTGGVTATPVVAQSSAFFNQEQVQLANTGPLTALSVTIVVQRTTGVSFGGQFNTVGSTITQTNSSTASAVTYTFTLASGQTLSPGTGWVFAAQTSGTGTTHPTAGDTFTVSYTTGGQTFTQTGHF